MDEWVAVVFFFGGEVENSLEMLHLRGCEIVDVKSIARWRFDYGWVWMTAGSGCRVIKMF